VKLVRLILAGLGCAAAAGCGPRAAPPPAVPPGAVPVAEGVWYSLDDGEERNRQDPDTFRIPPREARENLEPGQIVKLLFAITAGGDEQVERMWVVVERRDGADYVGRLDSQPVSTDRMRPGMTVRFQPRHVIDIHAKRAGDVAPPKPRDPAPGSGPA
jgi:hypothetical protein